MLFPVGAAGGRAGAVGKSAEVHDIACNRLEIAQPVPVEAIGRLLNPRSTTLL